MKKGLSFIVSVIIVLSAFTSIVFSEQNETGTTKEIYVLDKLGILEIDSSEEVDTEKTITRAEFSDYLAKAIKAEKVTERIYFNDVRADYWNFGSINALVEKGIINGTGGGAFWPDSPVTYSQACKMILSAAGYKEYVELSGGSIQEYVALADRLGIGFIPKDYNSLNFGEVAKIIFNGMQVNLVKKTPNNSEVSEDDTLFSYYYDVYFGTGVIDSYFGGSVSGQVVSKGNEALIDGEVFLIDEDVNLEEVFGCEADYIYKDKNDEKNIIYVENAEKDEITISSQLIKGFDVSSYTLSYYKSEDSSKVNNENLSRNARIIYNGEKSDKKLSDIINEFVKEEKYGSVKIINDDMVIVKSYEDFVISYYDSLNEKLYGSYPKGGLIDFSNFKNYIVSDSSGFKTQLPALKDALLSVAKSENGDYLEIIYCMDEVTGTVEAVNFGDRQVTINGKEYKISKHILEEQKQMMAVGSSLVAKLNTVDEIAYISNKQIAAMSIGYMTGARVVDGDDGLKAMIKIYSPDAATLEIYNFAERVRIDGVLYKNEECTKLLRAFPEVVVTEKNNGADVKATRQIIRYTLNEDGEITEVDTFNVGESENKDYTLTRNHDGSQDLHYFPSFKRFGMDTLYDTSKTKMIYVPTVDEDGNIVEGGVVKTESLNMYKATGDALIEDNYYIESYKYNKDNTFTDVIVMYADATTPSRTLVMFDKIIKVLENDEVVYQMKGLAKGSVVKYVVGDVMDQFSDITKGDIIQITPDITGVGIANVVKLYDRETNTMTHGGINPYWYNGELDITGKKYSNLLQLSLSNAYSKNADSVKTTYNFYDMEKGIADEHIFLGNTTINVYDSADEKNPIRKGTVSDIKDYITFADDASKVLVSSSYTTLHQVFIYN